MAARKSTKKKPKKAKVTKKSKTRKKAKAAKKTKASRATKKKVVPKGNNPAFDLIVAALKRNPNVEFAVVKKRAEAKNLTIHPVMYGRAKLMLGLVKAKPKKARKKTPTGGPGRPRKGARRGPGRPRKTASPMDAVRDLLGSMQDHERENARLRATLEKIGDLIDKAL